MRFTGSSKGDFCRCPGLANGPGCPGAVRQIFGAVTRETFRNRPREFLSNCGGDGAMLLIDQVRLAYTPAIRRPRAESTRRDWHALDAGVGTIHRGYQVSRNARLEG